jgi:hypothetical protein
MSRTLQFKRYANTVVANTTGAPGELIVDTTNYYLTIHDGVTPGGHNIPDPTARALANTATANISLLFAIDNYQNTAVAAAAQTEPQNAQTGSYTLQSSDAGKHLYYTNSTAVNLYLPWTANTNYVNGTFVKVISHSSSNVTITPNTGVSLYSAGNTTSGNHNVTTYGVSTLQMVAANTWYIYGFGVN